MGLLQGVLAGIIVVALKGMFLQFKDLFRFWRLSSTDALVWIITFLTVVILDIAYGLLVGALLCFAKLIALSMKPYTCKLALVAGTEIYLDINRYEKVKSVVLCLFNEIHGPRRGYMVHVSSGVKVA